MKKFLFLLIIVFSFVSCQTIKGDNSNIQGETQKEEFVIPDFGYELYYGNFEGIQLPSTIPQWIVNHVTIIEGDSWRDPQTILESGYCTLNEYTILFMNIAKVLFDIEQELVFLDLRDVFDFGLEHHPLTRYEGIVYDVYDLSYAFYLEPDEVIPFNKVFKVSEIKDNFLEFMLGEIQK